MATNTLIDLAYAPGETIQWTNGDYAGAPLAVGLPLTISNVKTATGSSWNGIDAQQWPITYLVSTSSFTIPYVSSGNGVPSLITSGLGPGPGHLATAHFSIGSCYVDLNGDHDVHFPSADIEGDLGSGVVIENGPGGYGVDFARVSGRIGTVYNSGVFTELSVGPVAPVLNLASQPGVIHLMGIFDLSGTASLIENVGGASIVDLVALGTARNGGVNPQALSSGLLVTPQLVLVEGIVSPGLNPQPVRTQVTVNTCGVAAAINGSWSVSSSNNLAYRSNSSAALDDYAIWDVFLSAGTWTLDVVYNTAPNGAQATVTVAGTVLSPPIDTFATTPATLDARFTGIVVAQTGITTISQLATGKDTGSTGYTMQVAQYIFTRTA